MPLLGTKTSSAVGKAHIQPRVTSKQESLGALSSLNGRWLRKYRPTSPLLSWRVLKKQVSFVISQHPVTISIGTLDSCKKTSRSSILLVKEWALVMKTEGSCDLADRSSGHKTGGVLLESAETVTSAYHGVRVGGISYCV